MAPEGGLMAPEGGLMAPEGGLMSIGRWATCATQ